MEVEGQTGVACGEKSPERLAQRGRMPARVGGALSPRSSPPPSPRTMPRLPERSGARLPVNSGPSCQNFPNSSTKRSDVLAYMTFPPQDLTSCTRPTRSSASPARSSGGPRGGRHLPNEDAIVRLIGAILLEQNDEWAVQRARYMTLDTIAIER